MSILSVVPSFYCLVLLPHGLTLWYDAILASREVKLKKVQHLLFVHTLQNLMQLLKPSQVAFIPSSFVSLGLVWTVDLLERIECS